MNGFYTAAPKFLVSFRNNQQEFAIEIKLIMFFPALTPKATSLSEDIVIIQTDDQADYLVVIVAPKKGEFRTTVDQTCRFVYKLFVNSR